VDAQGRIYITGTTASAGFPLAGGPYQLYLSSWENVFFSVIDFTQPTANQLVYSTYLGGENLDESTSLALDPQGGVWLAGYTTSPNFPVTSGAVQPTFSGVVSAWLARMDITKPGPAGLTYSTFFNGSQATVPFALVLDSLGRPTIGGYTTSPDLPVVAPIAIQAPLQLQDGFLATIDPTRAGSAGLVFSTFFGGSSLNTVTALTRDIEGDLFVGGYTTSADFPLLNGGARLSPAGADDGFFLLLKPGSAAQRAPGLPERPGRALPGTEQIRPPGERPVPSAAPSSGLRALSE